MNIKLNWIPRNLLKWFILSQIKTKDGNAEPLEGYGYENLLYKQHGGLFYGNYNKPLITLFNWNEHHIFATKYTLSAFEQIIWVLSIECLKLSTLTLNLSTLSTLTLKLSRQPNNVSHFFLLNQEFLSALISLLSCNICTVKVRGNNDFF